MNYENRRNSNGEECGARLPIDLDYDAKLSGQVIELPDTLSGRIDVFLHRWHWRGSRVTVTKELYELISWARSL